MMRTSIGDAVEFLGRRFHVGPTAEKLLGRAEKLDAAGVRGRRWPRSASCSTASARSCRHSSTAAGPPLDVFWLLALWTVFQAGAGFPVAFLRERGRIGPRTAMIAGAVLLPLGPLSLAHGSELVALIGYSVLSGTGAGLVYATCSATVAKWYPERQAAKVSLATGAFAYGSVPFAVAFLFAPLVPDADVTAAVIFVVVLAAGACWSTRRRTGGRRTSTRASGCWTGGAR